MLLRLGRLFRAVGRDAVVLWYACRHPAMPRFLKFACLLLAVYVISPVDLIPDWFPILGWIDDVTLVAFAVPILLKLAPEAALCEARGAAYGFLSRLKTRLRPNR